MPFTNAAYEPVTIALMTAAFEEAWSEAQRRGLALVSADAARDLMATTILTAVDNGERHPMRLKELALNAVEVGYT
jgi:hypothetical protein